MALAYVTRTEAKAYSRIQHTALDTTIDVLIEAASAAVKNYLNDFSPYEGERDDDDDYVVDSNYEPVAKLDSNGNQIVKPEVKMTVLLLVDRWLKQPPNASEQPMGYLPVEVTSILYPLRDPALK